MEDKKTFNPQELSTLRAWHVGIQRANRLEEEALALFKVRIIETREATDTFDKSLSDILVSKGYDPKSLKHIDLQLGEFIADRLDGGTTVPKADPAS